MLIFFTKATEHLTKNIRGVRGVYTLTTFPDGELYVQINQQVTSKKVWVVAATNAPAEHTMELLLLVDALHRSHAHVSLLLTYVGYARQDHEQAGNALGAQIMARMINLFTYEHIKVIHTHSQKMHELLEFDDIMPYELFKPIIATTDVVVAPDKGAHNFATLLAKKCGKQVLFLEKKRSGTSIEVMLTGGDVQGKKVTIVDDMISTGNTVIEASKTLLARGASAVEVIATHGLFTQYAHKNLQDSSINKMYVTNTLPQQEHPKITVLDIGPLVQQVIEHSFPAILK